MNDKELISWLERATLGALIIKRFEPSIRKACRNVSINEQHDLQQYINEKIIRAVLHYDMSSIPDFNQFVESVFNDSYNSCQ